MFSAVVEIGRKFFHQNEVDDSNWCKKLHHRTSVSLLAVCALLVCAKELFGKHISCIADEPVDSIIENYCFWTSTFILANASNHHAYIYPGVGPKVHKPVGGPVKRIAYYQWVPCFVVLMALFFYFGRYLWKITMGERLPSFISDFKATLARHAKNNMKIDYFKLAKEMRVYRKIMMNRDWGVLFIITEVINIGMLVTLIFLTELFLQYQFLFLGPKVIQNPTHEFLGMIFPIMTKCEFTLYGPSGTVQLIDALCVIPLNVVHEKLFIFLWFYFLFVLLFSCIGLLEHCISLSCFPNKCYRRFLQRRLLKYNSDGSLILKKLCYIDFLFIKCLQVNLRQSEFSVFLQCLIEDIQQVKSNDYNEHWQPEKDFEGDFIYD